MLDVGGVPLLYMREPSDCYFLCGTEICEMKTHTQSRPMRARCLSAENAKHEIFGRYGERVYYARRRVVDASASSGNDIKDGRGCKILWYLL